MEHIKTKRLRFLNGILTRAERYWLQKSYHRDAMRYRRLDFLLHGVPGDEKIESMMSWLLLGIISNKVAYEEVVG